MSGLGLDPVREARDVGIDQYRAGLGEYLGAVASDAWANSPLMQAHLLYRGALAQGQALDRGEPLLSAEEASEQGRDLGLRFDAPIARGAFDVLAEEKRHEAAAEITFKRARLENGYGTLHWLLGGGAEFLTMAVDPLNMASAFVPIVGEARYAAMAARVGRFPAALAKGAAEGAGGQLLLEPLTAAARMSLGNDYTMLDTLTNLAFGGGLGVVLHGAGYGIGAGFRFLRDRYSISERAAPAPEAASRTADVARREELSGPVVEKVAEPPPRQPVAEQMERLRPETKDAAMRSAVAQLVQDRPVDIEPVLRADPNWPEIKAAIDAGHAEVLELQRQSVASQRQSLPSIEPPPEWRPSPEELRQAVRAARGWEPEEPLRRPQSLADFVRKNGGLILGTPEAAELVAADLGRQPGLLRTREQGRQADHMAQAVADAGFRLGREGSTGSGVDVDAFVKALVEDASGRRKHFPDGAHTTAWQVQQDYFAEFRRYLADHLALDPKGMQPRQLAWLLRQDPDTARLMTLVAAVDRLGPDTSLELAARLDAERVRLQQDVLAQGEPPLRVHHGSPNLFDRFGADHIGAGEGTQMEGRGHYFSADAGVGDARSGYTRPFMLGRPDVPLGTRHSGPGYHYEVDLHLRRDRLLDWNKPLADQPPAVRRLAEKLGIADPEATGEQVYRSFIRDYVDQHWFRRLTDADRETMHPEEAGRQIAKYEADAGNAIAREGIPGARYTAGGHDNFVVFPGEEDKIRIARRVRADTREELPLRPADHRDLPATTLEELERYYADVERAAGPREAGRPAVGERQPAGSGPIEGGQAPAAGSARRGNPTEAPGLRREGDAERSGGPDQGTAGDLSPTPDELARFAERQPQADLHADPEALRLRDERLAGEARETAQLLQDDLRDHGHLMDETARELFEATGRVFDDEAKAIDALAACRIGGES